MQKLESSFKYFLTASFTKISCSFFLFWSAVGIAFLILGRLGMCKWIEQQYLQKEGNDGRASELTISHNTHTVKVFFRRYFTGRLAQLL